MSLNNIFNSEYSKKYQKHILKKDQENGWMTGSQKYPRRLSMLRIEQRIEIHLPLFLVK